MTLLATATFFTLFVSFVCSLMEATLLSVPNSYIKSLLNEGKKSGKILWEYKKQIDRPIAGILTLNTIANTMGATIAGAQAQKILTGNWVGGFAIFMTLGILLFSEITPKTIGAIHWRKTAPIAAYIIELMMWFTRPFIEFSQYITKIINTGAENSAADVREELAMSAEISEDSGAVSPWELKIIRNILSLDQIRVKKILTPRTVVMIFPKDFTVKEVMEENREVPFSRIPIFGDSPDNVVGMVLRHDIFRSAARGMEDVTMESLMRPCHGVPESLPVSQAIELFVERREQMFVVIDEYGGTKGIVTLEDALEALLGSEIVDEKDTVTDMQQLALRLWRYRAGEQKKMEEEAAAASRIESKTAAK